MGVDKKNEDLALAALREYARRGDEALQIADSSNDDRALDQSTEFLEAMRQRDIAFYNFRALDELALNEGCDITSKRESKELWKQIESQNRKLAGVLTLTHRSMRGAAARVNRGKAALDGYQSGTPTYSKLKKSG